MKHVSLLIKPASSLCNLKCTYCFYNDISSIREVQSYGIMSEDTTLNMIRNVYKDLEDTDHLTLAFQGGEPTLAGIDYYKNLIEVVNSMNPNVEVHYAIQTNGYTITEEWAKLFKENDFLVGLSIDGPQQNHDSYRKTWNQEKTFKRILESKKILDDMDVEYNILTVLTEKLSKHPDLMIDFINEEDIEYLQLIPCLEDFSCKGSNLEALKPESFFTFYEQLYIDWLDKLSKGKYMSIKLFDDILNLFVHRQVTACGITGNCQIQMVVEGDGTTFPCDFYVLDEYTLGNITKDTPRELMNHRNSEKFIKSKDPLSGYCKKCPYVRYCAGGCKRMKKTMYVNEDETYCGYKSLLDLILPDLGTIVSYIEKIQEQKY